MDSSWLHVHEDGTNRIMVEVALNPGICTIQSRSSDPDNAECNCQPEPWNAAPEYRSVGEDDWYLCAQLDPRHDEEGISDNASDPA